MYVYVYINMYVYVYIYIYIYILLILDRPLPHGLPKLVQLAKTPETGQNLLHGWIDVIQSFGRMINMIQHVFPGCCYMYIDIHGSIRIVIL